ncbi:MAG: trypsin-like peptidase domain-containing protein [Deinococcota bacterium]
MPWSRRNASPETVTITSETSESPAEAVQDTSSATDVAASSTLDNAALIDALGRDIAEQRVVDVYERTSPAVVNITTRVLRRDFFHGVIPEEGAGSGFVFDADGHILTNYHVIRRAQQIEVSFGDDTVLEAEIVGTDPRNDIAVLRVDAPAGLLMPLELGDSDNLQVGQRAIAIGNPFGQFGRTLTTGVISALDRNLRGPEDREIGGIIQTDAAINRGNSGGPLLDSNGQVIGMNTAIFSPSGTNSGVGFAIPVSTIQRVLPELLTVGRYRHPWLGIRYVYPISERLQETLNLPVSTGLVLVQVFSDSPLADANVRGAQQELIIGNRRLLVGGDIITEIGDTPVSSLDELDDVLETQYRVGDEITATVWRGNERFRLRLTLAEAPTN